MHAVSFILDERLSWLPQRQDGFEVVPGGSGEVQGQENIDRQTQIFGDHEQGGKQHRSPDEARGQGHDDDAAAGEVERATGGQKGKPHRVGRLGAGQVVV